MLEYCTVLKALFADIRASKLRVSPSGIVFESEPFTSTVPGSSIEFLEALPYVPTDGATNAAVLNQRFSVLAPLIDCPGTRLGRNELPAPEAISATVPE